MTQKTKTFLLTFILLILFSSSCILLYTPTILAQETILKNHTEKNLTVKLSVKKDQIILLITDKKIISKSFFSLSNPSRIVIDIKGSKNNINKNFSIKKNHIENLRIGSHPNKTRIVLDINTEKTPDINQKTIQNKLSTSVVFRLSFQDKESLPKNVKVPSTPIQRVKVLRAIRAKQEQEVTSPPHNKSIAGEKPLLDTTESKVLVKKIENVKLSEIGTKKKIIEPKKVSTVTKLIEKPIVKKIPAQNGKTKLEKIVFLPSDTPSVEFTLTKKVRFTFLKKTTDTYILKLHDCTGSGKHTYLPYFPPHTFPGVNYVQAKEKGGNIEVTLLTQRGVRLAPIIINNRVIVKVTEAPLSVID